MKCPSDDCNGYGLDRVKNTSMPDWYCNSCQKKYRILEILSWIIMLQAEIVNTQGSHFSSGRNVLSWVFDLEVPKYRKVGLIIWVLTRRLTFGGLTQTMSAILNNLRRQPRDTRRGFPKRKLRASSGSPIFLAILVWFVLLLLLRIFDSPTKRGV